MTLTYEDRTGWKLRLEGRLARACESLCRRENSLRQMKREARIAAAEGLGIRSLLDERDEVLNEAEQLRRKEQTLRHQMLVAVSGEPPEEVNVGIHPSIPTAVEEALDRESKRELRVLLRKSETGRTVLALQQERRELEDRVMLARSEAELQSLWASILERTGQSLSADIGDPAKTGDRSTFEG